MGLPGPSSATPARAMLVVALRVLGAGLRAVAPVVLRAAQLAPLLLCLRLIALLQRRRLCHAEALPECGADVNSVEKQARPLRRRS